MTLSTARKAIRLLSTLHNRGGREQADKHRWFHSSNNLLRAAFTPDHFPKTLVACCITGFCSGYGLMEYLHQSEVQTQEQHIHQGMVATMAAAAADMADTATLISEHHEQHRPLLVFAGRRLSMIQRTATTTRRQGNTTAANFQFS